MGHAPPAPPHSTSYPRFFRLHLYGPHPSAAPEGLGLKASQAPSHRPFFTLLVSLTTQTPQAVFPRSSGPQPHRWSKKIPFQGVERQGMGPEAALQGRILREEGGATIETCHRPEPRSPFKWVQLQGDTRYSLVYIPITRSIPQRSWETHGHFRRRNQGTCSSNMTSVQARVSLASPRD